MLVFHEFTLYMYVYVLVHITHLHLQITYDLYRISTYQNMLQQNPQLTRPSCLLPAAAVQCSPEVCWVHGVRGPRRVGVAVGFWLANEMLWSLKVSDNSANERCFKMCIDL